MENYIDNLDFSYILIIGWMDMEVFAEWFVEFVNAIKEQPLLLTFDGHMTHVSLPVIEKALQDKIIMLKFPPHATDVLQPLDVSCFGSLKHCWEQLLQQQVNTFGAKTALSKGDFVNQLYKIWKDGVKLENIVSSIASTGSIDFLMLLW